MLSVRMLPVSTAAPCTLVDVCACCVLQSLEAAAVTYARMQDYNKAASYLDKLVSPDRPTLYLLSDPRHITHVAVSHPVGCTRTKLLW
jgi:hypothetical protein